MCLYYRMTKMSIQCSDTRNTMQSLGRIWQLHAGYIYGNNLKVYSWSFKQQVPLFLFFSSNIHYISKSCSSGTKNISDTGALSSFLLLLYKSTANSSSLILIPLAPHLKPALILAAREPSCVKNINQEFLMVSS